MRTATQLAVIAILGGGAYLGWQNWPTIAPLVAKVPGLSALAPGGDPAWTRWAGKPWSRAAAHDGGSDRGRHGADYRDL